MCALGREMGLEPTTIDWARGLAGRAIAPGVRTDL